MKKVSYELTEFEIEYIELIHKHTELDHNEIVRRAIDRYVRWFFDPMQERYSLEFLRELIKRRQK